MDVDETLRRALADRYRLERELGQGGMATVYLAEDLKHHRKVAVKVLRPDLAAALGPERFLREVTIAANLQHPNILPVHDSGEAEGFLFYVMPYVEGASLRERLSRETELPVPEAARILRDVADALSAAHAKGVVHRDIKPENVLLTGRHALVADFGVAKAVSEATGRQTLTTAGVALGTPTYMAPEQAAASPQVDPRADLYAFGVMAYEMLTGQPPFVAATPQAVLAAHVTEAPVAVTQRRATLPPPLAQLIMKCLAKRAADRPQSAEELLPVLDALTTPSGGITPTATVPIRVAMPRRRLLAMGALAAVVVLGVAAAVWLLGRRGPPAITVSDLVQVTSEPGVEFQPAISPDGREVAFVAGPMGPGIQRLNAPRLVIRSAQTAVGGGEVRFGDSTARLHAVPQWSPSGDKVRFVSCGDEGCEWSETGRLGGAVRPVRLPWSPVYRALAMAPDGDRVAGFAGDTLLIAAAGDSAARRVAAHPSYRRGGLHSLAWSPDGRRIAYVSGNPSWVTSGNVSTSAIWVVSASGGEPIQITDNRFLNVSPVWLDDGNLLFVSNRDGARGVYVVAVGPRGPRGEPRLVPGVADPHSISYSPASRTLAYAKFTLRQNIWAYPLRASAPVSIAAGERVTTGSQVVEAADVSPDGRWLVFDSNRRGSMDIYKQPIAGGEVVPLTALPEDAFGPRWSPDGSEVAFYVPEYLRDGVRGAVMVVSARGGEPVVVTSGHSALVHWSPDGLHLEFGSNRTGRWQTWLVSRDSVGGRWGGLTQLTDFGCTPLGWDPGGDGVVCVRGDDGRLAFVTLQRQVRWVRDTPGRRTLSWGVAALAAGGRAIVGTAEHRDGRRGVWAVPLSGDLTLGVSDGVPRLVAVQDDPTLSLRGDVAVGPDRVYVTVSEYESDVWVAKLRW